MALPPEDTSWTWHLKHSFLFRDPWYILKISGLGNRRISFRKKRPEDILRMHLAAPLCTFMYPPPKLTWQWKKKHLKILKMYLTFKNGNVPLPISKKNLQRSGILFKKSIKVQEARIPRCAPWTKCDRGIWKEPSKVVEANQFLDCWVGTLKLPWN